MDLHILFGTKLGKVVNIYIIRIYSKSKNIYSRWSFRYVKHLILHWNVQYWLLYMCKDAHIVVSDFYILGCWANCSCSCNGLCQTI